MNQFKEVLITQNHYVKQSRATLLNFCTNLSVEELLTENSSFGRGSVVNLLTHIGNTYLFWIGEICLAKSMKYVEYGSIGNIEEVYKHFSQVDGLMNDFFAAEEIDFLSEKEFQINGRNGKASILKIVSHVFTHEFHHKGQILSLSRHLGYIPVDTDIMR